MLMGAALFGGRDRARAVSATLGGLAPDAPSFALVLWAGLVERRGPREIFEVLYFSPEWQLILGPSHSAPLWTLALVAALVLKSPLAVAFIASGLVHHAFDFALHADDAHRHLWPRSDWRFESPVSYWDPAHYGMIVAPMEAALALGLAVWLARIHRGRWLRAGLVLLGLAYFVPLIGFLLVFRD